MKILCAADVHIGRRPSRLPERIDTGSLSCARAWEAIVDRAISEKVDLLLVAGDLVDEKNRYYEAAGPVEAGVRALADAGIELIAVAGNHDVYALMTQAQELPYGEAHTVLVEDALRRMAALAVPRLPVLSYSEVTGTSLTIETVGAVGVGQAITA